MNGNAAAAGLRSSAAPASGTVLIADDHPLVAHGIERVLSSAPDFDVVGACHSGHETLALAQREQPDFILLDVRLGDLNGAVVCQKLRDVAPAAKVVMLTAFDETENLRRCLEAGAAGVLLKGTVDLDLAAALREVRDGRVVIDSGIAEELETTGGIFNADRAVVSQLRPRELDVLRLMAAGMTTRDIATELFLSVNTIRTYTQSLMVKLDAHTRVQAVVFAQQIGVI